jgi:pimeloyl-ACP methyl ester carboxylesterase
MRTSAASSIPTYFRVSDGVRVRFADNEADADVTVLLLSPWPESLWAFRRIWDRVAGLGRVVAIDLPGFGHSDGRPELIAPDRAGAFLAHLIDEWGLGAPHVVGPDVGTAAALFLAATAPEHVTSLTIGGGAVRFPIEAGGALKDIIEAPSSRQQSSWLPTEPDSSDSGDRDASSCGREFSSSCRSDLGVHGCSAAEQPLIPLSDDHEADQCRESEDRDRVTDRRGHAGEPADGDRRHEVGHAHAAGHRPHPRPPAPREPCCIVVELRHEGRYADTDEQESNDRCSLVGHE